MNKLMTMMVLFIMTAACGGTPGNIQNQNQPELNPVDQNEAGENHGGGQEGDEDAAAPADDANAGAPDAASEPVPYFDALLTAEQREGRSEKYRPIFSNERLLSRISLNRFDFWPAWSDDLRRTLLEYIIHFEETQGDSLPPFGGDCVLSPGPNACYQTQTFRVASTLLNQDYADYVRLSHIAWNLYVEANRLVPWSLLDYSDASLSLLFGADFTQPVSYGGVFGLNTDSTENYKIMTGSLRAPGDTDNDLIGENATASLLNTLQFVGERITHIRGTSSNTAGPSSAIWPYAARDEQGHALLDAAGDRVPLDRMPTPREILVLSDPHHDLARHPEDAHGPHYHIVNGCWGASQLLRALLTSVNLPVYLEGDYAGYGGHSGITFLEIDGEDYRMQHSDNFYYYAWAYGLLKPRGRVSGTEIWSDLLFQPMADFMEGYNVLHDSDLPLDSEAFVATHVDAAHQAEFAAQLPNPFSTFSDLDMRVMALRALANPPSIQNRYTRCAEPGLERRHIPTTYLTAQEEQAYRTTTDALIATDRQERGQNLSCFDLYHDELDTLYKAKTGVSLDGDEDNDGFVNHRDCNLYAPDNAPCEGAFKQAIAIRIVG